jgi:hypothetical protein
LDQVDFFLLSNSNNAFSRCSASSASRNASAAFTARVVAAAGFSSPATAVVGGGAKRDV